MILIDWFTNESPNVLTTYFEIKGNFVNHHWGFTSIHKPLSYPFRSLVVQTYHNPMIMCVGHNNFFINAKAEPVRSIELKLSRAQRTKLAPHLHRVDLKCENIKIDKNLLKRSPTAMDVL